MMAKMEKLKEEMKVLKSKNKAKRIKLKKYKLILDNIASEQYDDDMDEEDGIPSEEEEGEDIEFSDVEMNAAGAERLLNEDDGDTGSDSEDSDFELDQDDKDEAEMDKNDKEEIIKDESAKRRYTDKESINNETDVEMNETDEEVEEIVSEKADDKVAAKEAAEEAEETDEKKEEECESNFTQTK